MPKMIITGLAQETSFSDPEQTRTVLVIDNGGLRLPIDESAVEQVLIYAINGHSKEEPVALANGHSEEPQEEEEEQESEDIEEVIDEAGISQI